MAGIIIALSITYTSLVWGGFKTIIELSNLGVSKFLIQYVYYAFESLLMMLIIAHGQKAFESWFGNIKCIPFGGILLAITWGLIHILTQGTLTGIYAVICVGISDTICKKKLYKLIQKPVSRLPSVSYMMKCRDEKYKYCCKI